MRPLIITNGSAAVDWISRAGLDAEWLPWDDVLHDGPVQSARSHDEFADSRARFMASLGWGEKEEIRSRFRVRDERFERALEDGQLICCWFEHDLYDQLQVWEVLSRLDQASAFENPADVRLTWIQSPVHITSRPQSDLLADWQGRAPLSRDHLEMASRLWNAFTGAQPEALWSMRGDGFPGADTAIRRWTGLFPSFTTGLDQVESVVADALADGPQTFGSLFQRVTAAEDAAFLGDWSFASLLRGLASQESPWVEIEGDDLRSWTVTRIADPDPTRIRPRWVGGVQCSASSWWSWDAKEQTFRFQERG